MRLVPSTDNGSLVINRASGASWKEQTMGGDLIGLVAVTLGMGVPLGMLYTYYRVRKLRSEERLGSHRAGRKRSARAGTIAGSSLPAFRDSPHSWGFGLHRHVWLDCSGSSRSRLLVCSRVRHHPIGDWRRIFSGFHADSPRPSRFELARPRPLRSMQSSGRRTELLTIIGGVPPACLIT